MNDVPSIDELEISVNKGFYVVGVFLGRLQRKSNQSRSGQGQSLAVSLAQTHPPSDWPLARLSGNAPHGEASRGAASADIFCVYIATLTLDNRLPQL